MKLVINGCYGGFGLSDEAVRWIRKNAPCEHRETLPGESWSDSGVKAKHFKAKHFSGTNYGHSVERDCPSLIACVEAMGEAANGRDEYDGIEHVAEQHRTWR